MPGGSAHRVLNTIHDADKVIPDPGDGGTISYGQQSGMVCSLTSGASGETRILEQPTGVGIIVTLYVETDGGGDIDVTATGGIDADGTPTAAMDEAADLLTLISVPSNSGSDYRWAQIGNVGAVVIS